MAANALTDTTIVTLFNEYSRRLDDKYDKYERIYKASRDITNRSKKVIFTLQRIPGLNADEKNILLDTATTELNNIDKTLFKTIATELCDEELYQFIGAYTAGIQEYIEAVALYTYILHNRIISLSDIQKRLVFNSSTEDLEMTVVLPLRVFIPAKEYILGLADLTGELMRLCIKCVSTGDFTMCYAICGVLKHMHAGFLSLGYITQKELNNKLITFRSSLHKVEEAQYSLQLRKSEVPADMLADLFTLYDGDDHGCSMLSGNN